MIEEHFLDILVKKNWMPMNREKILKRLSFYSLLHPKQQEELQEMSTYHQVEKGEVLFSEGERCGVVALVGSGDIRVFKLSETGRKITLYHVRQGEGCVLNLACAFSGRTYTATAETFEATEFLTIPAESFKDWVERGPIRDFVFELFSTRLSQVITLVEEIVFRKMDQRLADFLLERFENHGKPRRTIRMTQEEIATELGTAREVVNRLLKELELSGAIAGGRGILRLASEERLREFTGNR
ncbi:MAG: Crp/Fnr family transcriptional regulator [Calditrichia bacterium]